MKWYYAVGEDRKGPVDETELQALIAAGTVKPDSLVWHAQLDGWQSAASVGLFGEAEAAAARAATVVATPAGEEADEAAARRDGKHIVVPLKGGRLPHRCVKTNQPVDERDVKKKMLYWCSPWVLLSALISLLITIILYLILRKKVEIELPLSSTGRSQVTRHVFGFLGVIAVGFAVVVYAFSSPGAEAYSVLGMLICLGGLIYGAIKGNALRVAKVKDDRAWLLGACPEFLEALPPYEPER